MTDSVEHVDADLSGVDWYARDLVGERFIGCRFTDWSSSSYAKGQSFSFPPAKLIHIDIDPHEIGKIYPAEVGILADARPAVAAIVDSLPAKPDRTEYLAEVAMRPPDRIDHAMRVLHDPVNRTYSFTYSEGARLIRPWLEIEGQTLGFQRLLAEEVSPAVLLRDLAFTRSERGDY